MSSTKEQVKRQLESSYGEDDGDDDTMGMRKFEEIFTDTRVKMPWPTSPKKSEYLKLCSRFAKADIFDYFRKQIKQLSDKARVDETEIQNKQEEINQLKNRVLRDEVIIQALEKEVNQLKDNTRKDAVVINNQQELLSLRSKFHELETAMQDSQKEMQLLKTSLKIQMNGYQSEIAILENKVSQQAATIEANEDKISELEKEVAEQAETIQTNKEGMREQGEAIQAKEEEITSLQDKEKWLSEVIQIKENEVSKLQTAVTKHTEINTIREKTIIKLEAEVNEHAATVRMKEEVVCKLEEQVNEQVATIRTKEKQVRKQEEQINEHSDRITQLEAEIARYIGDGPVDVAGIENVNSKNRPTHVADAYINLMNDQWLDALIELDQKLPENKRIEILQHIMKMSWKVANDYLRDAEKRILAFMDNPFSAQIGEWQGFEGQSFLPDNIKRFAFGRAKEKYDQHDLRILIERTNVKVKCQFGSKLVKKETGDYIAECCRVAWRMVLQHPKMELAAPLDRLGKDLDPLKEEHFADSKPRGTISGYVKAGLVQGDKYFVKAMVCLD